MSDVERLEMALEIERQIVALYQGHVNELLEKLGQEKVA